MKTKKRSSSKLTPRGYGPLASFRGIILARRGAQSWGARNLIVQNFRSCPLSQKSLRCKILDFVLAFIRIFCPGTRLYSRLVGAQAVFWGSTDPEIRTSGTKPVTFFCRTIFASGDTSNDLGARPQNVPRGAGPE